jgi:hypothetical protein
MIALHDSIMPRTGCVVPLQSELRLLIDNPKTEGARRQKADSLWKVLNEADKIMYSWMRSYNPKFSEGKSHQARMDYLNQQINTLTFVQEKTEKSVGATRDFLGLEVWCRLFPQEKGCR